MNESKDIRQGMTSASNASADNACPGRHLAQRGAPEEIESKDATMGTKTHLVHAGLADESTLDDESLKTLRRAQEIEAVILRQWLDGVPATAAQPTIHREERLWATRQMQPVHSGQADAFWRSADGRHALLEDLKSLYGEHQDADENEQLRDLAALIWKNYNVQSVTAFINQPRAVWRVEDVKLVRYERNDLVRAYSEMMERVAKSNDVSSPRIVGAQCTYCRAAGTARCPESQRAIVAIGTASFDLELATPAERGDWLERLQLIEKIAGKAIGELKQGIRDNGETWAEGWGFGKLKAPRSIEPRSIPEVGAILSAHFDSFTPEKLADCCKLSVPDLENLHGELSTLKGKEASDDFKILFGHLITAEIQQPPIVKLK